jgi:putative transposase
VILSYKYRLYQNRAQRNGLGTMLGAFCDLYNAALQQRIEAYDRQGKSLGFFDQAKELRAVRAEDERLASYSFSTEQQVLRRLDKTFKAFFSRLKSGGNPGFPRAYIYFANRLRLMLRSLCRGGEFGWWIGENYSKPSSWLSQRTAKFAGGRA